MTNAEVIARLKANREEIFDIEKSHRDLREHCRHDRLALTIAIRQLERAERRQERWNKLPAILYFLAVTLLGMFLTKIGMQVAYAERGYFAIGGEILLLPFTYFIFYGLESCFNSIKKTFKELLNEEKNDETK
ncbi:MAG: hypothetical protein Q4A29_03930 [Eubacteriales bacterium]|nr:hypothetical protein [Eubacteriales bacterium]